MAIDRAGAAPYGTEAAALLVSIIWGANFVAVKAGTDAIGPFPFAAARLLLGGTILLTFVRLRAGPTGGGDRRPLIGLGLLTAGSQACLALALRWGDVGGTALMTTTIPLMVMVISAAIGTDRITSQKLMGVMVAFVGVLLLVAPSSNGPPLLIGVDALAIGSATLSACYISFVRPSLDRFGSLRASAWTVTVAGLALLAPGLLELRLATSVTVTPSIGFALIYSGVAAAAIGTVVMFRTVRWLGPIRAGIYQFLVPLFALLFAAAIDGEAISLVQVSGAALVGAGILVSRYPNGPSRVRLSREMR